MELEKQYLSAKEFADLIGVNPGTLANWRSDYNKNPKGPRWEKGRLSDDGSQVLPLGNEIWYSAVEVKRWMSPTHGMVAAR